MAPAVSYLPDCAPAGTPLYDNVRDSLSMWRVGPIILLLIFFGLPYQQAYGQTELSERTFETSTGTAPLEDRRGTFSKVPADRADNAPLRIYVVYGQYGWTTSSGMYSLAQSLARYGEVSIHEWDDRTIVPEARRHSGKIVLVGFSLGANTMVAIANKLPHVDLIVAYDPSRLSPLVQPADGEFRQHVASTVRRAICFYNPYAWYFGGARLEGSQVETFLISNYHLAVAVDQRLHEITEEAVKQVATTPPVQEPPVLVASPRPSTPAMKAEEISMDMPEGAISVGADQELSMPNAQRKISLP
jgi:hypothetical protein